MPITITWLNHACHASLHLSNQVKTIVGYDKKSKKNQIVFLYQSTRKSFVKFFLDAFCSFLQKTWFLVEQQQRKRIKVKFIHLLQLLSFTRVVKHNGTQFTGTQGASSLALLHAADAITLYTKAAAATTALLLLYKTSITKPGHAIQVTKFWIVTEILSSSSLFCLSDTHNAMF